jgi:peptide/nickel transport system ATP-binding protein
MALACEPKLLIADEPSTALDVTVQAGILDVLRDLRDRLGTSILIITHDLGVIADLADRVVVMYAGRVVEQAPLDDIFAHPRHRYLEGLLGASPKVGVHSSQSRLREIPGLVPVLTGSPDRCTFAERCGFADEKCRTERPPLAPGPDDAVGKHHVSACWHPRTADGPPPPAPVDADQPRSAETAARPEEETSR